MSRHTDAIGYLNDLTNEVGEPWFKMICDLAAIGGVFCLTQDQTDILSALIRKQASYLGVRSSPSSPAPLPTASTADFLETLSAFSNFKLLQATLQITLTRRITLIFGTNGSGKSSLCESLKVLASTEQPNRPLNNVRLPSGSATSTTFSFKFKSDANLQMWSASIGYGSRQSSIKYFDTGIAIQNVKGSVEPGRIIVLTPFKLHVFEWVQSMTVGFRDALHREKARNAGDLERTLQEVRSEFVKFTNRPLASIDESSLLHLSAEIKKGEAFADHDLLKRKQSSAAELERAASEEGIKLLKAEHRELGVFLSSLETFLSSVEELWSLEPADKTQKLAKRQTAQELLAKELIPNNGNLDQLHLLLNATSPLCNLEAPEDDSCPVCRRKLGESEVALFKRYHELLVGELEVEISALKTTLKRAEELVNTITVIHRQEWSKNGTLSAETLEEVKKDCDVIVACCGVELSPSKQALERYDSLKLLRAKNGLLFEQKASAIEAAAKGRDELAKRLTLLRSEIESLEYEHLISENLESLRLAQHIGMQGKFWNTLLPTFTPLLKRITDASKAAHEDLVVSDFETRLNAEYLSLTNRPMTAFGVKLARKGSDAAVTVLPQIGGNELDWILSEGEKRVHALALFFAELEGCSQSVIVFDDPVSSFDYDYIANYCRRLRDYLLCHSDKQIIVLTHNWEFFVQLQTTLNLAGLNGNFSVQVIENCSVVADYTEKIDDLKVDVVNILGQPGEPTRGQKEEMAGKLRRLIEAIVNTHVFNKQRHQYKQKSSPVSDFQHFTKLVPLLPSEATSLRDLYSDLSITEHDDIRNAYVNTDKATFQTRYSRILAVEAALISRK